MFGLRFASESRKRTKNGQPPHNTTGVASASSSQDRILAGTMWRSAGNIPPIASTSSGAVTTALTQNLRVMSTSSGLGSPSADATRGSSAMPQIGHAPGALRTISGCIGQVHWPPAGAGTGTGGVAAAGADGARNRAGSAANRSRQCRLQK